MPLPPHPAILIIIDGFALNPNKKGNAVKLAKMPNFQRIWDEYPHTTLKTSGLAVGLPEGQMGNSEVGHMNIGAGRVVYQDLTKIDKSIQDKTFFNNQVLLETIHKCKKAGGRLHLIGLVSDGGVHSHIHHVPAIASIAKENGIEELYLHAQLDGRDTPPKSAGEYLSSIEESMNELKLGKIATVMGRFYGMDRDKRWDRSEKAYNAMVLGEGLKSNSHLEAINSAYEREETDEFVQPTLLDKNGVIKDNDAIFFFNFRADRMRQITRALTEKDFSDFSRSKMPSLSSASTMTEYQKDFTLPVAFPSEEMKNILGEVISKEGWKQLRIAETEKYAHVTFFFNGGRDKPFEGEERVLIQSPKDVKTYDQKPEMSAREVTSTLVDKMKSGEFQLVILNFANADMVGHSGKIEPVVKSLEVVDECLGKLLEVIEKDKWIALITSDHGNSDQMLDYETGKPLTSHTTYPVPLIMIDPDKNFQSITDGKLSDIAPTILFLSGLAQPKEMTGRNLLEK